MIRYTLTCDGGHRFDSWFQSAEAHDKLHAAGMIACAVCGTTAVEKALMAPAVQQAPAPVAEGPLSQPAGVAEQMLADLRRKIEAESDYVGLSFATEARAMHEGRAPERSIWGQAKLDEARALLEDGIPVAPLPFLPKNRTN